MARAIRFKGSTLRALRPRRRSLLRRRCCVSARRGTVGGDGSRRRVFSRDRSRRRPPRLPKAIPNVNELSALRMVGRCRARRPSETESDQERGTHDGAPTRASAPSCVLLGARCHHRFHRPLRRNSGATSGQTRARDRRSLLDAYARTLARHLGEGWRALTRRRLSVDRLERRLDELSLGSSTRIGVTRV